MLVAAVHSLPVHPSCRRKPMYVAYANQSCGCTCLWWAPGLLLVVEHGQFTSRQCVCTTMETKTLLLPAALSTCQPPFVQRSLVPWSVNQWYFLPAPATGRRTWRQFLRAHLRWPLRKTWSMSTCSASISSPSST